MKKKVLLYSNETLFEAGVSSIIAQEGDLELTIIQATSIAALLHAAQEHPSHVVLIERALLENHEDLLNRLLKTSRVIVLEQNHNLMHVYSSSKVSIEQASDLIQTIRSAGSIPSDPKEKE